MAVPTLEELQRWFDGLDEMQRICRVMVKDEAHMHICGRDAVGLDRHAGPRGLVCAGHRPANPDWFVELRKKEAGA